MSPEELRAHARVGNLQPNHFVRPANSNRWVAASKVKGLIFREPIHPTTPGSSLTPQSSNQETSKRVDALSGHVPDSMQGEQVPPNATIVGPKTVQLRWVLVVVGAVAVVVTLSVLLFQKPNDAITTAKGPVVTTTQQPTAAPSNREKEIRARIDSARFEIGGQRERIRLMAKEIEELKAEQRRLDDENARTKFNPMFPRDYLRAVERSNNLSLAILEKQLEQSRMEEVLRRQQLALSSLERDLQDLYK